MGFPGLVGVDRGFRVYRAQRVGQDFMELLRVSRVQGL